MEYYTQQFQNTYPLQAHISHCQVLTFICQYWALYIYYLPQSQHNFETDSWAGSLICPFRLTLSLLCPALCPATLAWMGCIHGSFPLWLLVRFSHLEPRAESVVGKDRVNSFTLPAPSLQGSCICLPLPKSAAARQHSPDSCPPQVPVPILPLPPLGW